jgi:beta-glucosidase
MISPISSIFRFSRGLVPFILFIFLFLFMGGKNPEYGWIGISRPGDSILYVQNPNGPVLGYSTLSGVHIIQEGNLFFKDLNKNGKLDPYEDWRNTVDERVKDLASRMTKEQIAGLMLYSAHQAIPALAGPFGKGTYGGKIFKESGAEPSDITDQQRDFLVKDNLRHVLITSVKSPADAALWNNKVQALVEGLGLGIPTNNSSDPRHSVDVGAEYTAGAGGKISQWPEPLGMAATFDPELVRNFGHIASQEYRALGISTALSPQIDLGTEPRWIRINGTFGEDPGLASDMARAYVDGFQTSLGSKEIQNGWGYTSVNAMIKHWPGGGPEEGGRDAHYAYGKYAVYPGNNFDEHVLPFVDGGMKLGGKTQMASALMPYYTISYQRDTLNGQNLGNGYSQFLITNLLRNHYHFDGVVCTDWGVTADEGEKPDVFKGKSWGMEKNTVAERHYKVLMAGVDQFGGNNDAGPVLEAYAMGVKEHGEEFMRTQFERSARRLLRNIMHLGLFENPYLKIGETQKLVGSPGFMEAGYKAQLKSIVLLKNVNQVLPLKKGAKVYIPQAYSAPRKDFFNNLTPGKFYDPIKPDLAGKYFDIQTQPELADYALVFVSSPNTGAGYDTEDLEKGGNGYVPISLQYGPYTAVFAREHSLAAGDPVEPGITNRSYKNKTITASNYKDLEIIRETVVKMKGKPVIVCMALSKPTIVSEFEKQVPSLLVSFGVQNQALLDIITGVEPQGLLPFQMPANMKTVEKQNEDVPHDMDCYKDSQGHIYDFGYGLNWKGIIDDSRTNQYVQFIAKPKVMVHKGIAQIVSLTPKSQVYYSLDGSSPAFIPVNIYHKPIILHGHGEIRAIAKRYGVNNSSIVSVSY